MAGLGEFKHDAFGVEDLSAVDLAEAAEKKFQADRAAALAAYEGALTFSDEAPVLPPLIRGIVE